MPYIKKQDLENLLKLDKILLVTVIFESCIIGLFIGIVI